MTVQTRLGTCFVCLVFKTEMHQPKIVASLVTVQIIHRLRADSCFLSFSVHEERQHNEKLGWLTKQAFPAYQLLLCGWAWWHHPLILLWRLQCYSYGFYVFFLSKECMGESISMLEGVPAWWIADDTWWYLVLQILLQIHLYALPQGHSVKLEMLQLLERNFFGPFGQENVSTILQIQSFCECNLLNLFILVVFSARNI